MQRNSCYYKCFIHFEGFAVTSKLPDKTRYEGWVTVTWILAGLTGVASLILVGTHGTVEIPRPGGFGTTSDVNVVIWAIAIGQTLGALLVAALFSMVNSIYQNSCDLLSNNAPVPAVEDSGKEIEGPGEKPISTGRVAEGGLLVKQVRTASQLDGILRPGYKLLRVNGEQPDDELSAAKLVVNGENDIEYMTTGGEVVRRLVPMRRGPLHITFQSAP